MVRANGDLRSCVTQDAADVDRQAGAVRAPDEAPVGAEIHGSIESDGLVRQDRQVRHQDRVRPAVDRHLEIDGASGRRVRVRHDHVRHDHAHAGGDRVASERGSGADAPLEESDGDDAHCGTSNPLTVIVRPVAAPRMLMMSPSYMTIRLSSKAIPWAGIATPEKIATAPHSKNIPISAPVVLPTSTLVMTR